MADVERDLLSKVLREQAMAQLAEARITDRFFADAEHLRVLEWMREHWKTYGTSPSVKALQANYPTWKLSETPEPLDYYVDRVRKAYRYDILGRAVSEAAEYLEEADEVTAQKVLAEALSDVDTTVSVLRDHNLTDPEAFDRLFDYYDTLTRNPGSVRGYPTGWPTIDLATMGLSGGQLVTIVGPPKGGKSTIALSLAEHIQRHSEVDVLLISFEMSYDEMVARWTGIRARLNYRRLLKGQMNDHDVVRMERLLVRLKEGETKLILSEDISSTTTVSGVIAKIQQHRPKVVVIDGVYLMDDEHGEPKGSAAAITNITRSLKRVAQLFDIPVVITTQTLFSKMRGQTIKASSIGYSSSFGQDSDVVIATEPREDADTQQQEHWLKILLSRSGPQVEVRIDFDWSTSTFTEFANSQSAANDDDLYDDGEMRGD
jgi:replicative DNA helicase